ncbi:MAG: hypothetical protein NC080_07280 [Paraprevotella sp.]|nr:hypothetical protein [Paraprevotella sp.]
MSADSRTLGRIKGLSHGIESEIQDIVAEVLYRHDIGQKEVVLNQILERKVKELFDGVEFGGSHEEDKGFNAFVEDKCFNAVCYFAARRKARRAKREALDAEAKMEILYGLVHGAPVKGAVDYRDMANQFLSYSQRNNLPEGADGYYGLSWRELLLRALKDEEQFIYREAFEGDPL